MKQEIHWHRTAPPPPDCDVLDGDQSFDVVIVGAGLTGLRTAISLAEAGVATAVIDAQQIAFGSSGRSGGQCNPIWRSTPDALRAKFGAAQGARLIQATLTCADDLFDDIRRYKVDCGAEQNGWVQAAHTRKAAQGLQQLHAAWADAGAQIEILGKDQTQAAVGSDAYDFALFHRKGGCVHPLGLTRGYAKTAQSLGARLFENAPATAITRRGAKWEVTTPQGKLICDKVVLTTNAYTDDLWPKLRQTMLPLYSIAVATTPLTKAQQAQVLPRRQTVSDTRLAIYFARYDADDRLIFGCVGSGEQVTKLGGLRRLHKGLTKVFPALDRHDIECGWGGRIGVTQDMIPRMYQPAEGILAGVGFSGRGIAMTSVMGRSLARKILGGHNDDLAFPVSPITPIPLQDISRRLVPVMAPTLALKDQAAILWDLTSRKRDM